MILEDRTYDRLESIGSPCFAEGLETWTTTQLIQSELIESMTAPLFTKYRTEKNNYLYDCGTGRIVKVDEVIYTIIDDFAILTNKELLLKYRKAFEKGRVKTALREVCKAMQQGLLAPHHPAELSSVDVVALYQEQYPIDVFWKQNGTLLVLGITEQCNLRCLYCCYSGNFAGQRTHSQKSMTWEIAEKAISYFLEHDQVEDGICPITFYGSESLLEFELIKQCVAYAETKAATLGKHVLFSVTTNGTLLSDDIVDYLVEHDFFIVISLDGPKAVHDRYRVFPDGSGSFELIEKNLRRFAKRYPEFKKRGLNVTLTPPLDLEATACFIEELYPDYPVSRVALVNTGMESRFRDRVTSPLQYGCHTTCNNYHIPNESFRSFSPEDHQQLKEYWKICMQQIAKLGVTKARERFPFAMLLFEQQIIFYHRRKVTDEKRDWYFYIPCIPGFTRRFCDADGNYRVCERVDNSSAYLMGNVWDGPDSAQLRRIMEMRRHFGDCANCTAHRVCDICYARIPGCDAVDAGFDPMFDLQCQQTRKTAIEMLQAYTEIMEANPNAFEPRNLQNLPPVDKLRFGTLASKPGETDLSIMKYEELPSAYIPLLVLRTLYHD